MSKTTPPPWAGGRRSKTAWRSHMSPGDFANACRSRPAPTLLLPWRRRERVHPSGTVGHQPRPAVPPSPRERVLGSGGLNNRVPECVRKSAACELAARNVVSSCARKEAPGDRRHRAERRPLREE
jgi:hypothetical protein